MIDLKLAADCNTLNEYCVQSLPFADMYVLGSTVLYRKDK